MGTRGKVTDVVEINGAKLYYEKQGTGPSIILIAGSTGDAGHFSRSADLLADEFTVVVYDRRGNSRSPRPPGWTVTSVAEQADDAAGLIQALGLAPAVVFGASAGAPIALDVMLRHGQLVHRGILQDPSIFAVLPDPMEPVIPRRQILEEALQTSGPRGAIRALVCYLNDDAIFAAIPADVLERMLGNADTLLAIESPGFAGWPLTREDVASLRMPVSLMIAAETLPEYRKVIAWLADELKVVPVTVPGKHAFYCYRPQDLADALRTVLRGMPRYGTEAHPQV